MRSSTITWVGVRFPMVDVHTVVVSPEKFLDDLVEMLKAWQGRGMVATKELRSVAGRTSWLAGVLPPTRWVVSVFYATLKDADREERRQRDEGSQLREKPGLFYVKRLEGARIWLVEYMEAAGRKPHRRMAIGGEMGPQSFRILGPGGPRPNLLIVWKGNTGCEPSRNSTGKPSVWENKRYLLAYEFGRVTKTLRHLKKCRVSWFPYFKGLFLGVGFPICLPYIQLI